MWKWINILLAVGYIILGTVVLFGEHDMSVGTAAFTCLCAATLFSIFAYWEIIR